MRKWLDKINEFQMMDVEKHLNTGGGNGLPPIDPPGDDPWGGGDGDEPGPIDPDYHNGIDLNSLDEFTSAYLEAICYTEEQMAQEEGWNTYVTSIYGPCVADAIHQCADFQKGAARLLDLAYQTGYGVGQAGHDFWLTRCRQSVGFWDRGLGDVGKQLTELAIRYGEPNVWVDGGSGALMVQS